MASLLERLRELDDMRELWSECWPLCVLSFCAGAMIVNLAWFIVEAR